MRILAALLALALAACNGSDEPPPDPPAPQGRAETQSIRNTDAIGYSGSQIADKVDNALTATEQREREQKEAVEQQTAE